jgi:hypothetical protein
MGLFRPRGKRLVIEWLAAEYRDVGMLPPDEAMRRAVADYERDPEEASRRAGSFAGVVEGMTGQRNVDPRRVGRFR